jgi:DNA-binding NtrC family response regulator
VTRARVLCVDDDPAQRRLVSSFLGGRGYEVIEAETAEEAIRRFAGERPDLVLLDYVLPDGNGLELLARFRALEDEVPIVMVTGHGDVELAVEAIRAGAENFVLKPMSLAALETILKRAVEHGNSRRRQLAGRRVAERRRRSPFLGRSEAIRALAADAELAARSDSPVLLVGETGTGKGVLARFLHEQGDRAEEAFVDLNCAGLSRDLLESELFGHARGAFTGAVAAKAGLVETAHKGTLFLDEIGDLDASLQPKLLKVLEEKTFRRVGEVQERRADTRLVAATNADLQQAMRAGRFRSDLYFRISTFVLRLPALRERREDLPLLVDDLLDRLGEELGRRPAIVGDALDELARHAWPGNIRELRNVLERAVLGCRGAELTAPDLRLPPPAEGTARAERGAPDGGRIATLAELEREAIERALARLRGNVVLAAQQLGVPRSTLYAMLKSHGLQPRDFQDRGGAHAAGEAH